ncbi:protein N-lysine methyltransferase METTL21A-like [Sycon ciliatum]|uniref:protein N-lysine methyltransferase METTL21A-like n=1 Tax=Sycon ciliatum TaxID=27933 RepID=UPI0031F5FE17
MAVVLWKYSNPYAARSEQPTRQFTFKGHRVDIAQNLGVKVDAHHNTSEKLWDGSFLLASFLESAYFRPGFWHGKRCVELGCGTGLVGIVAWLHGARVALTDQEAALERARQNVTANVGRVSAADDTLSPSNITVEPLDWCKVQTKCVTSCEEKKYDVILGSEVVYLPEMSVHLLATIERLSKPGTDIFICYKERGLGEDNFWKMLAEKGVTVETMPSKYFPEDFAHSSYRILKFQLANTC